MTTTTAPPPSPPLPSGGDRHGYPRTYAINLSADIGTLWKFDWVVAFPWMDVQSFHAQNPTGIATTYVRNDIPAAVPPGGGFYEALWHETSLNVSYQGYSVVCCSGMQERNSMEAWTGGNDTLTDGQAANVGFIRAWQPSDTAGLQSGCYAGSVCHAWALNHAGTGAWLGQLTVYLAKRDQLYGRGWDGVWTDNAACHYASAALCDGFQTALEYERRSLPGKYVGGNGISDCGHELGWSGSDPNGFFKMGNMSLTEGAQAFCTGPDNFVRWINTWLNYPDPYGQPRYNAYWDFGGDSSLQRMRWGLTLAMMASSYYESSSTGWYDEFWGGTLNQRGYLGLPTATAVKLANGVWRRDFQNGVALNNSSGSAQTVSLGGTYKHLTGSQAPGINDGSSVSSVTIPNQDGLILLR